MQKLEVFFRKQFIAERIRQLEGEVMVLGEECLTERLRMTRIFLSKAAEELERDDADETPTLEYLLRASIAAIKSRKDLARELVPESPEAIRRREGKA